jgi:Tfp pilus assembly protein PilF
VREEYARIRSNMGECFLKLGKFERAVVECSRALAADVSNVKAWYRRAKGWSGICGRGSASGYGAAQKARDDVTAALKLDERNAAAQALLKGIKEQCQLVVRVLQQVI